MMMMMMMLLCYNIALLYTITFALLSQPRLSRWPELDVALLILRVINFPTSYLPAAHLAALHESSALNALAPWTPS